MKLKHLLPLLLSAVLSAQAYALTEGEDYLVLDKPIPQKQSGKIEVLEFFGYFCVHCHHFDPLLLKLGKALPSDAYLRTEHVVWQPEMLGLARMAAAVKLSGLKYQANPAVFKAVYEQKIRLENRSVAEKWALSQKGFDGKKTDARLRLSCGSGCCIKNAAIDGTVPHRQYADRCRRRKIPRYLQ